MSRLAMGLLCCFLMAASPLFAEEESASLAALEAAFEDIDDSASAARQRLAVRRIIRDAEKALEELGEKPERWAMLEFLFRAQQQLVAMDDDSKHRKVLMDISRDLVKAPEEFAIHRLEADLLLSQVEQARKGEGSDRADSLRQFVDRYVGTPAGPKALRTAIVMALEMGDTRLVNDLRKIAAEYHSSDLEMITFLRDKLGGQVFGVPFVGRFERSDGRTMMFPMDGLGHSSMLIFWSKDNENVIQYLTDMAAAAKLDHERVDGRLQLISVNVDELPDAGESIIRGVGADWPCLHFPGGRDNPQYKAYVRRDPYNLRVAPTGQSAMVMAGSTRKPAPKKPEQIQQEMKEAKPADDLKNYTENFRRTLIRGWSRDDYAMHLSALMSGDFLAFDPEGFDPSTPPELRAVSKGGEVKPIKRTDACVPEETLAAIQDCLVAAPQRYLVKPAEVRRGYQKMQELCRKAIADHPDAPDLWIVRNRLILSHLGLWKTDFDPAQFEAAVTESRNAIAAGYPEGCDVIARFTLARESLRQPEADWPGVIDAYVADQGGESAAGVVFATASLLALDVADEARYQRFRDVILEAHTEASPMWLYSSFLLSRYHDYWMFQVPFTAGWSFGRREKNAMHKGGVEEAERYLKAELPKLSGGVFRIPEDLQADYTVIYLAQPQPWKGREREDPKPPSPSSILRNLPTFVASRSDTEIIIAMLGDTDEAPIREDLQPRGSKEVWGGTILRVPGGMDDSLVHRLGLLDSKGGIVLLNKKGRILNALSGSVLGNNYAVIPDTIQRLEEAEIMAALEKGDMDAAKALVMKHVPPYDPEAVDERGRKLPKPKYSLHHLRARCHYYMALKEWDKALADAQEVHNSALGQAGGMSLRTPELDESEALLNSIRELAEQEGQ
ncbi:MAG: hypothetical protein ACPG4K_03155 [Haloferula sp.]